MLRSAAPQRLPVPALVKKSEFVVIKALFDAADTDGDGLVTQGEFEAMITKADPAEESNPATKRRYMERLTSSVKNHLLDDLWRKIDKARNGAIDLSQMLAVYFPRLSAADRMRVVNHYCPAAPVPVATPSPILNDIPGAVSEINEIFNFWDRDGDGLCSWFDLQPSLQRAGVGMHTARQWLQEAKQDTGSSVPFYRLDQKLSHKDVQTLLSSNYLSSQKSNHDEIMRAYMSGHQSVACWAS